MAPTHKSTENAILSLDPGSLSLSDNEAINVSDTITLSKAHAFDSHATLFTAADANSVNIGALVLNNANNSNLSFNSGTIALHDLTRSESSHIDKMTIGSAYNTAVLNIAAGAKLDIGEIVINPGSVINVAKGAELIGAISNLGGTINYDVDFEEAAIALVGQETDSIEN